MASQRLGMLKTLWSSSDMSIKTKFDVYVSCVFSRLLYAAETWTIKAADSRKLLAFEMRRCRRILRLLEKQSHQQKCQRKSRKALHYNGPDKGTSL